MTEVKPNFRRGAFDPYDRPTNCYRCRAAFHGRPALKTAALHISVRESQAAAQAYVDEQLEDFHAEHG